MRISTTHPGHILQVAALGVPYVLMHMRGTPQTMQEGQHTDYQRGDAWRAVSAELQQQADKAVAAGIPAWHIILDPGKFCKRSDMLGCSFGAGSCNWGARLGDAVLSAASWGVNQASWGAKLGKLSAGSVKLECEVRHIEVQSVASWGAGSGKLGS